MLIANYQTASPLQHNLQQRQVGVAPQPACLQSTMATILLILARYTVGKVTISGGYNYTKLGDVTVLADALNPTREHACYRNNDVSALGLKIGVGF